MKILVIEDDATLATIISEMLLPASVSIAASMARAVDALMQYGPAIVLLDLSLPDSRPEESLRMIETIRVINPAAKVYVMTGYLGKDLHEESMKKGADAYLDKNKSHEFFHAISEIAKFASRSGTCYHEHNVQMIETATIDLLASISMKASYT